VQETNNSVGLFKMPVKIEVHYKDGSYDSVTAWIQNQSHEITIPDPQKKPVAFVLFDPGKNILKKITFDKSLEELSAQAKAAPLMIDRYDALVGMRNFPVPEKKGILFDRYHHEKFHLTKSEIIHQLAAERDDSSVAVFRLALSDPDARVRKGLLSEVSPIPFQLREDAEKALQDSSYLNIELALQNLCLSFPDRTDIYLERTKNMTGWRGLNIRMKWLEIAIGSGKADYLPELAGYSSPVYEFETRMNSLSAMKKLRYIDDTVLENARQASKHWNNKLRDVGKEYLTYFGY